MKKSISIILAILMCFSCFSIISFAETTDSEHITTVPEGYVGIYTKDDLDNIKLDSHGKYILMNDIVFTEEDYAEGGSFYNSGKGWSPIPSLWGIFNGNGYVIYNLTINNPNADYQGLFGQATSATICNVTLINAKITGGNYTSGICGRYSGRNTISNCIVSGTIAGKQYVGGICGKLESTTSTLITLIDSCVNFADISGTYDVGGICGNLYSYVSTNYNNVSTYYPVKISQCINAGNITAKYTNAGGIVGFSLTYKNIIENSYNTGTISGTNSGGIVGYNCSVQKSYSIGTAKTGTIGGDETSTKYCYYLDSVEYSTTYTNGIGKSHDQMVKQTTYAGWDFDTVWTMEGREDYPYPELRDVPLVLPDDKKIEISAEISIVGDGKVGSVLSADIKNLAPENATYSYEWTVGNTVVSTEETYTVAQADVNKDIILTIKGNGDFKGKISSEALTGICVHNAEEFTYNNDATCTKNGTNTATCLLCGNEYTVVAENTMVSHTFENYIYQNDATCTNDGTSVAKCEYCDATDSKTADGTKTGHSFYEAWIIDKEATCSEEGIKSHHCKNCDAKTDETALKKLAHEHSTTVTNATCSENGKIVYTCICGDTYTEIIYASGHIDNDGDTNCDSCYEPIETEENDEPECKCICHEKGIFGIVYKILVTVQRYFKVDLIGKVFKMGRLCECGEYHY
ncbi:MAG: hypothetical protein IKJ88_08695 [Clostridia bacterium]|nr:hypothetical protein [Clostridia bacterium]